MMRPSRPVHPVRRRAAQQLESWSHALALWARRLDPPPPPRRIVTFEARTEMVRANLDAILLELEESQTILRSSRRADTGRVARAIELDPQYADVICRRWAEHTGGEVVADSDAQ